MFLVPCSLWVLILVPSLGIEPGPQHWKHGVLTRGPPGISQDNLFSFSPTLFLSGDFLAVKSLQSCPTLCDPIDGSPPGSPVPGILQARTLEWVAISFSNAGKWKVKVKSLSHVWLLATPWTAAYQAPPSMGFSRQEYWSGVPLPSPGEFLTLLESHLLNAFPSRHIIFSLQAEIMTSFFDII